MPTGTWERLPASRRAAVTEAAEQEFAERGFSQGSLNTIARTAGVSKGSLFQYFDDKADLFTYLAGLVSVRIRAAMEGAAVGLAWDTDFFGALRELNRSWVAYFYDHPVDLAITAAANLEPDRAARQAVLAAASAEYQGMMRPLIALAEASGQLVDGADVDALLALLLLLLPHIALAPHVDGLDTVLGLVGTGVEDAILGTDRLLGALQAAYART
ncbi:TetR/AcrR family transcriptional regulator [Marmoricola sp. RAF53]|uniref:TetR/AcrR family transcriptional regulator n=1 Tax=Marmoricola sp. RAF53 TaxID=3233059 RepID=UPI003F97C452